MRRGAAIGIAVGLALGCALGWARPAEADPILEVKEIERGPKWSYRLAEKMTIAGDELGLHLRAISFNSLDLDFDGHKRIAHMRVQAGQAKKLALELDSDVAFQKGYARVAATVKLGVMGKVFKIDLPEFDMVPRTLSGQRYVELRLPVIDLRF
jgi:hypothetical protein